MEIIQKPCANCGKPFFKRRRHSNQMWADAKFCSRACYGKGKKTYQPKVCVRCFEEFEPLGSQQKICLACCNRICPHKKKYPWRHVFRGMLARCENPKSKAWARYGGRGIKIKMTAEEVREIWIRDKAYLLKEPSIDRIDNDGHYEIGNIRFIELVENRRKRDKKL